MPRSSHPIVAQVRAHLIARRRADHEARPQRPLRTWGKIAERARVRPRVVSRFANGEAIPRSDHLLAIAEALGCRITIDCGGAVGSEP